MANDEPEEMEIDLDAETHAHLSARAEASGRSISDQLVYELKINRGLCSPDPDDTEGTERAQLMKRILHKKPLMG